MLTNRDTLNTVAIAEQEGDTVSLAKWVREGLAREDALREQLAAAKKSAFEAGMELSMICTEITEVVKSPHALIGRQMAVDAVENALAASDVRHEAALRLAEAVELGLFHFALDLPTGADAHPYGSDDFHEAVHAAFRAYCAASKLHETAHPARCPCAACTLGRLKPINDPAVHEMVMGLRGNEQEEPTEGGKCPTCKGTCRVPEDMPHPNYHWCPDCGGSGKATNEGATK